MALLQISGVLPTLHIVRRGVDENIAFLLAGFNIILSDDRQEVVRIVVYYLWCVESESFVILILLHTSDLDEILERYIYCYYTMYILIYISWKAYLQFWMLMF